MQNVWLHVDDDIRLRIQTTLDPEIQALADLKGDLPNSASESKEGALGLAYVGDGGLNLGVSVTRHRQTYQVPIRYSLDPAVEPEAPTIDVEQTRYDARAEIPIGGFFSALEPLALRQPRLHGVTELVGQDERRGEVALLHVVGDDEP